MPSQVGDIERNRLGRPQGGEDGQQILVQIHGIVFAIFGGEAHKVRNGLGGPVEDRVQESVVDTDLAPRRRLQQTVRRGGIILVGKYHVAWPRPSRYSSLSTLTVISAVTSRCSRTGTLCSPSVLIGVSSWILRRSML